MSDIAQLNTAKSLGLTVSREFLSCVDEGMNTLAQFAAPAQVSSWH
jgi:hypothetical protein